VKKLLPVLLAGTLTLVLVAGCKNETPAPQQNEKTTAEKTTAEKTPAQSENKPQQQAGWTGKVVETMDAGGYTYVQVDTGSEKIWAAAPKFTVKVGDPVVVPQGMAMKNYHSKTLDRDFPVVYFVDGVMVGGTEQVAAKPQDQMPKDHPKVTASTPADIDLSDVKPVEGGQTIEQLYKQTDELAGKKVTLRGKVVKYNENIMGKNWIHIQDGTGAEGTNDLTVTTTATAKVGDTVVVSGVLVADKDFGYGYKYALIIEDAEVKVE